MIDSLGIRRLCIFLIAALSFSLLLNLAAQQSPDEIARILDRHPCADVSRVKIWHYDYVVASAAVEALSFVPTGAGPFRAALLIPVSRATLFPLGAPPCRSWHRGHSRVPARLRQVRGPSRLRRSGTLKLLTAGFRRLQKEPFVDPERIGIYGRSRGGMAASLLAVEVERCEGSCLRCRCI